MERSGGRILKKKDRSFFTAAAGPHNVDKLYLIETSLVHDGPASPINLTGFAFPTDGPT